MLKKRWVKLFIVLIPLLLIINFAASYYFYNLAIKRGPKDFLDGNKDLTVSAETMDVFLQGDWRTWVRSQPFEQIHMEAFDGINLQGYLLEAPHPSNKLVVMAHGYLGRARDMGLFGEYYYNDLGYNIFMADARGHGQSEGEYIGFGWHDRLDYVDWIHLLIDRMGTDTEIILHGLSMGAATVLMASGEELPPNVKAIIADSPYTSVNDLFSYQITRMFNLPSFPILNSTSMVTKMKAGYSFKEASALEQVKKTNIPILYIHGDADTFVPTELTYELYDHTNSDKQLLIIEGASHGEAIVLDREAYIQTIHQFIEQY